MKFRRSEQGQASIMIGMMMMTFLLFFFFVVNVGMLVNAKINLQNAADAAAYAGAAVQARQLNAISFLNYEMRRQYKKFLFRYYVMGNMAQQDFPRNGGSGPPQWRPSQTQPLDYGIPTVCMIFNSRDNFCQVGNLRQIRVPPSTPLDAVNETLRGQLQNIEEIRQRNCVSIGKTNLQLLLLWLYNTDPRYDHLAASGLTADQRGVLEIVRGLAFGLGLVPREFLLRRRIDTLARYVNSPPQKALTKSKVDTLKRDRDPPFHERPIQAFLSAYHTLGPSTFAEGEEESIILDELLPPGTEGSSLLVLKDIKTRFDTYAVQYDFAGGVASPNPQDCEIRLTPVTLPVPLALGVYKDPKILTYYAIRLRAKAKIMFNPFGGNIELKAYAAARPFGSRIGPALADDSLFVRNEAEPRSGVPNARLLGLQKKVPNLPIFKESDGTSRGQGWDRKTTLYEMYQKFNPPGVSGTMDVIDQAAMSRGYQAAMVPNPWEGNKYNIPSDEGPDSFIKYFDSQQNYAFWAPVFLPARRAEANAELQSAIQEAFQPPEGTQSSTDPRAVSGMKQALQTGMSRYLEKLMRSQGENDEGFNIVRLENPFRTRPAGDPVSFGSGIMMTDPKDYKTSWNKVNDGRFRAEGRIGYSVKLVSFHSLTDQKSATNGVEIFTNDLPGDADSDGDLPLLNH